MSIMLKTIINGGQTKRGLPIGLKGIDVTVLEVNLLNNQGVTNDCQDMGPSHGVLY